MPTIPLQGDGLIVLTARDIVASAMLEAGLLGPADPISAEDAGWGLEKLQRIVDGFNAKRSMIFGSSFLRFTLIPNHAPHTIGPSGDFDVAQRPVNLLSASLILAGSSPNVEIPLDVKDDDWWAVQSMKDLTSPLPTQVYYTAEVPKGKLYFWPVPTVANDVHLQVWSNLTMPLKLADVLVFPPAYWDALVLTLAVRLCPSFGKEAGPTLIEQQRQAIRAIQGNNLGSPRMITSGSGMPGGSGRGMTGVYIGGGGGSSMPQPIKLSGAVDGVNVTFTTTTSVPPIHWLHADGVKLVLNDVNGYTWNGNNIFTLAHPPVSTIELSA